MRGLFHSLLLISAFCMLPVLSFSQSVERINSPFIHGIKLFPVGIPEAPPVMNVGEINKLELHFDDHQQRIKSYSYTWQLCNADWSYAQLQGFDFIQGYQQQRIITYRNSSISQAKYIHYSALLPERNCLPTRSGNYLLKVFENGDTSKLIFQKRVFIVQQLAGINVKITQPFEQQNFLTGQRLQVVVDAQRTRFVDANQQFRLQFVQNNQWLNAQTYSQPVFIKGNFLEYNLDRIGLFQATKEFRWLDLRSFRLQSDRIKSIDLTADSTFVYLQVDQPRSSSRYIYWQDRDGRWLPGQGEGLNPYWQADYGLVYFKFAPSNGEMLPGPVFLWGELTNEGQSEAAKMTFNPGTRLYEAKLWLKQGYYDYAYVMQDAKGNWQWANTEGNHWETENLYQVFLYYRPLGGRADELVGYARQNSLFGPRR